MATKSITLKRTIKAPVAEVYRLFTRASALRQWMCDTAQFEARKGGRAYFAWNDGFQALGTVSKLEPNKTIAYSWHGAGEPAVSQVKITFKEKNGATQVAMVHSGLGSGKAWAQAVQGLEGGWASTLENLQSILETGEDLRIVRRPMLGIVGMSALDAETAQKIGTPAKEGILVGGTVAGMGAEAAGLLGSDVIQSIGGKKTSSFQSLTGALSARHAGDTVPVVFYRGQEKLTKPMTLSRRPLPPTPASGAELASGVHAIHEREMAALAETLKDATEAETSRRPAEGEWSVKEILVHILTNERGIPDNIAELLTDSGRWYDDFDNENVARNAGAIAVYGTAAELVNQIRAAHAEQEAMYAAIPAATFANPRLAWQLGWNLLQGPTHIETHLTQIRAALEATRQS
ncbi:MAG: SRPBCC domain-containing protein [Anaerolineales bacterium]|nr:SRPBCC domain-containing protein [Anaerolineales bacterium]